MLIGGDIQTITNNVADLRVGADITGRQAYDALTSVLRLRNITDNLAVGLVGAIERLGVAAQQGRKTRELLLVMGCAPAVAARFQRIALASPDLPTLMAHAADGAISSEHVDAIVKGVGHIAKRSPEPVDDAARYEQVSDLLGQFFSGATPAEIAERAKTIGNQTAADTPGGLPAAEDRSLNSVTHGLDDDGRLQVHADLDAEVGEKFSSAIEELAAPRPEPDGSPDARSVQQRQADALEALLDIAARGADTASAPRTQVLASATARDWSDATLEFMGSISRATLERVMCDSQITAVIVDDQGVPEAISTKNLRLFPAHLRKALYIRDRGCIKCGASAGRCHAHHIVFWSNGGLTVVDNGCLLCPTCHDDVHHRGWEIIIGADRHPWLIPPATVDPTRRPLPAYNRRTMTLDAVA